jgi:4-diphosphocytidyl-2-C-methyl-D-erythritol kinase
MAADAAADSTRFWPAPAKLNLFLHVLGRRADGYHELQTIFQLIDLADSIGIGVREDGLIERTEGPADVPPESDLVVRAARVLQEASGSRQGATLRVRKRIPMGGGLGGGSSDAATVLLVLNRLWRVGFGLEELAAIGLGLGADVPVFVYGSSAWGEGRGERLQPLRLPPRWFVVLHPGVSISTREVFQAPELTRNSPKRTIADLISPGGPERAARNDCEAVVRARAPAVAAALDWLAAQAPARLTGTGACVFAGFPSRAEAERVAARVPAPWQGFVARGLDGSPLHECLRSLASGSGQG